MSKYGGELLESVKQMAAIERGEMEPARETVYDRRSKKVRVNIYLDRDIVAFQKTGDSTQIRCIPNQNQSCASGGHRRIDRRST